MRIVHLSTYDVSGGAAIAAGRLHNALRLAGEDSRMLVRQRRSHAPEVSQPGGRWMRWWLRCQRRVDRFPLLRYKTKGRGFSLAWTPDGVAAGVRSLSPDIIHAHWIADGFLRLETLQKISTPFIWTLHDMWAFTGGCHYSGSCDGFVGRCGRCPLLSSDNEADYSRDGWDRRRRIYEQRTIVFVACSRWMEQQARRSTLLAGADVRVIANAFDTSIFAPQDRSVARARLGLPQNTILILAGAVQLSDPRKGFSHLRAALRGLRGVLDVARVELIVLGGGAGAEAEIEGFRANYLGVLTGDISLARAYAAADVFVLPSLEDNLPNAAIEAMSVGVPVVAYRVGGVPEIVDHEETGLLVDVSQPGELGTALARMVIQAEFREYCGRRSRLKVLRAFDSAKIAEAHRMLYREVVERF